MGNPFQTPTGNCINKAHSKISNQWISCHINKPNKLVKTTPACKAGEQRSMPSEWDIRTRTANALSCKGWGDGGAGRTAALELWLPLRSHTLAVISSTFLKAAKEQIYVCRTGLGNAWENRQPPFSAYKSLVEGVFHYFCAGPVHDLFRRQGFIFIKLIWVQTSKASKCFHAFVTTESIPSSVIRDILGKPLTLHSQLNITFYFFIPSGETTTLSIKRNWTEQISGQFSKYYNSTPLATIKLCLGNTGFTFSNFKKPRNFTLLEN